MSDVLGRKLLCTRWLHYTHVIRQQTRQTGTTIHHMQQQSFAGHVHHKLPTPRLTSVSTLKFGEAIECALAAEQICNGAELRGGCGKQPVGHSSTEHSGQQRHAPPYHHPKTPDYTCIPAPGKHHVLDLS